MAFVHPPILHSTHTSSSLTLISLEGTLYHVDAATLRLNSDFFDTMLTLPTPEHRSSEKAMCNAPIEVFEQDAALSQFFHLVDGGSFECTRIENAYRILDLAEKWDCPLLLHRIRDHLSSSHIPRTQPLLFFALAIHFDWTEEALLASTHTLHLDIQAPEHAVIMERLPRRAAQSLLDLRRQRSAQFRRLLDNPTRFPGGNSSLFFCDSCCTAHPQDDSWHNFKNALSAELARISSGTEILALAEGGKSWVEADTCWKARCPTGGCGTPRFDRRSTLLQIHSCLRALPTTIDM